MKPPVLNGSVFIRSVRTGTIPGYSSRLAAALVLPFMILICGAARAADIVWTNLAGGNWNVTNNWSPNQVPGTNDTAWITNNGAYTVKLNISATLAGLVLGGTSGTQTLSNSASSLILNGPCISSSNGVYAFAGGTLDGTGTLTLAGPFLWTGGTLGSTGSALLVQANGGLSIAGNVVFLGGTLINGAAGVWSSGTINSYNTALFSNSPSGTFDFTADGTAFAFVSGTPSLANAGSLRKIGGTGISTIAVACNNSGSLLIQTGTVALNRGGVSSGQFSNNPGATLTFGGGSHILLPGSLVAGPGSVSVSSGGPSVLVEGDMAVGALTNSGNLDFASSTTDYITNLVMNGGSMDGTNSTVESGPFHWTSGTLGSAGSTLVVQADGGVNIGGNVVFLGGTVINNGPGNWSAGQVSCYNTALFSNSPSGTFDFIADGVAFAFVSGTPSLANAGTLRKIGGTGTSTIAVACNNSGSLLVQTGTVTLNRGGASSGQFSNDPGATLTFGGGSQTLLPGSGVAGPGNVTVASGATLLVEGNTAAGSLTTSGTLNFASFTTDYITNLVMNGGSMDGTNSTVESGPFHCTGGTLGNAGSTLVVQADGGVNIGGSVVFLGGTVINNGPGSWNAGQISCYNTALFSNSPSGTFDFTADGTAFAFVSGIPTLANAGTLRKTGGTGTSTIAIACNNSGSLLIQTGTVSLGRGGVSNGQFSNSPGATLTFGGGSHTLLPGSLVAGPGSVSVSSGGPSVLVEGNMAVGTLTNSGTLDFASFTTDYITNLVMNGGSMDGTNSTVESGSFHWTSGTLGNAGSTLALQADGGVNIGGSVVFLGGTVINNGPGSWDAGQISCYNTALFSNSPSGTFDFTADGTAFAFVSGTPTLANAGTLRKTAGTGTSTIGISCNNSGSLLVQTGTVSLSRGGASIGQFSNSPGATLAFGGGSHILLPGSLVAGPGSVSINSGGATLLVEGGMTVGALTNSGTLNFASFTTDYITNLAQNGGSMDGTNSTVESGPFHWTSGSLGSAGSTLVVQADGGINIGGNIAFEGGTLINNGPGLWTTGVVDCYNTALFSNSPSGTFDFTADGLAFTQVIGSPVLANAGTLRKTGGTGTSTISIACNNSGSVQANSGTLSFHGFAQNAGQTVLNGGNLSFTQTAQILGGILSGNGTVTGSVSNNATVSPGASPGLLGITGDYTQLGGGHLQMVLGGTTPGTQYDQLSVGGTARLAGSLDLSYTNGFIPMLGDVFTVVSCNARGGGFDTVTGPTNTLSTLYTAKTVLVEPGNAPPIARLAVDLTPTACHNFLLTVSGTDADGSVTNVSLMLDTNLLFSTPGSSAQMTFSYDFPGELTFTVLATDNKGAQGATNVVVTITPLAPGVLDPIGFQTNRAFKLCMNGEPGTNYQVLAKDNFAETNWVVLGSMQSTNGIWRYFDTTATNFAHRYYRAEQLP